MDSATVIAPFPNAPPLGDGNDQSNLSLRLASSTGSIDTKDVHGAGGVKFSSARRRRHKRLQDTTKSRNSLRRSPPTISEHQTMDQPYFLKEKSSLSADVTAETTILSTDTPECLDNSVRVRKVPSPSTRAETESDPLPQSILTRTQTFTPPDQQPSSRVPTQLTVPLKKPSQHVSAPDLHPSPEKLPRRRSRSQSLWDKADEKELDAQQKSVRKIPTAPMISPSFDEPKQSAKLKTKVTRTRPKPKLKRHATAPSSWNDHSTVTPTKQTTVVDDVLMDRAFVIRQNLMNFEMQELAAEAEKAAESGKKKFVGSTSKFGVEQTPPYTPKVLSDEEFVMRSNAGLITPSRRKKYFVDHLTYPMEYTPSYFSRKKIPVTSLRNFSEIVPNFSDMHSNIRFQLGREGVDLQTLPELHSRRSLMKNDTDDSERDVEDAGEDAISQAPSIISQAASHTESISSFSSYAVASLASLKEMIELVHKPKNQIDNAIRASKSMPHTSHNNPAPRDIEQSRSLRSAHSKSRNTTSLSHTSTNFMSTVAFPNSDSDDSSVEFYGRKSPIDSSSNRSVSSHVSESTGMFKSSLYQSRSNISSSSDLIQPVLYKSSRRKNAGASVSFESEKANYQALLDRMHRHNQTDPITDVEVDQSSCVPTLNIDLDILPTSPTTDSNKLTPVATFLSKIQNQFSRSRSASIDAHQKSSKAIEEDNKQFVSNFFYIRRNSDIVDQNNNIVQNLKLDINAEPHGGPFCMAGGCGQNSLLSTCASATQFADVMFDWFGVKGGSQSKGTNAIIDPKLPPEASPHPKWIKTWQSNESENNRQRFYTPPRLSVRHAEMHQDSLFCSPDSGKLGDEYQDTMACPEISDPVACDFNNEFSRKEST